MIKSIKKKDTNGVNNRGGPNLDASVRKVFSKDVIFKIKLKKNTSSTQTLPENTRGESTT